MSDARQLAAALRVARPYVEGSVARYHLRPGFEDTCEHCDAIRKDLAQIDRALEGALKRR